MTTRTALTTLLFIILIPFTSAQNEDDGDLQQTVNDLVKRLDKLEAAKTDDFKVWWNRGLRFESLDGSSCGRISGKIHIDTFFFSSDRDVDSYLKGTGQDLEDGVDFRRARISLDGYIFDRFIYKANYDFSGGENEFKDVYIGVKDLPLNMLFKAGHFKEPFSLESVTAVDGILFQERSIVQTTITPSRNTGVAISGTLLDERISWSTGIFHNADSFGDGGSNGGMSVTARIAGLPWRPSEDKLLHIGAAYSKRGEDDIQFQAGPESHSSPDFIDTDGFAAVTPHIMKLDKADMYGGEALLMVGPFSTQGEYVRFDGNSPGRDPKIWGYYLQTGYFLTGEHRSYEPSIGRPGRVIPNSNFLSNEGGPGSLEVAVRYSYVDLDDDGVVNGSELSDYTAGLNWRLNPSVLVSLNLIHSHLEKVGTSRFCIIRFALDF